MNTITCPRCHGSGEQVEHNLTGVDGDTSYDYIECRMCGGAKRVPAPWAEAWDETGLETRCDGCHAQRPCAIMENASAEIVIICAKCAATMQGGMVSQGASS